MDDDKARRNLVMVSSGILLAAWLDLPLSDIAEKALGIKHANAIDPGRAWLAVMAVLLYLAYRFTFSDDEQKARDALFTDWQTQRQRWQRRQLTRHLKRAAAGKADSPLFGNTLLEYFNNADRSNHIDRKGGGVIRIADTGPVIQHQSQWAGKADLSWMAIRPTGNQIGSSGNTAPFEYKRFRDRLPIMLAAGFVVVFRSKTSSVAVFPAALSVLAMGVAAYQVGRALFG